MALPITSVSPVSLGPEFAPPKLDETIPGAGVDAGQQSGKGFMSTLTDQLGKLDDMQSSATQQANALATGQAQDVSSVVMEVERASLALQLATQVRNKAVDAYQDIFRMQV
ncbi:MAG TPA: flagellar hook-basal body complex protein FliE [Gaiellaceae bacterium]|jgi:flagellar hook-basal body complex protein FliE